MDNSKARTKYEAFIAAIDNSIAGCDENGVGLAERVAGSAEANAYDTMVERYGEHLGEFTASQSEEYYAVALDTAKLMLDDWRNNYPELRI